MTTCGLFNISGNMVTFSKYDARNSIALEIQDFKNVKLDDCVAIARQDIDMAVIGCKDKNMVSDLAARLRYEVQKICPVRLIDLYHFPEADSIIINFDKIHEKLRRMTDAVLSQEGSSIVDSLRIQMLKVTKASCEMAVRCTPVLDLMYYQIAPEKDLYYDTEKILSRAFDIEQSSSKVVDSVLSISEASSITELGLTPEIVEYFFSICVSTIGGLAVVKNALPAYIQTMFDSK